MGGFASVLGHAASGFESARQADLQRQFEDIQNRRAQHISLLGKLASDETVHPDVRNWAVQSAIEGSQTPLNKNWEPKWKEMPTPKATPAQSFTPPPAPPMDLSSGMPQVQTGERDITGTGQGITAPPPSISLPPAPPQTATLAPQPQSIFMSPAEHTAMLAQRGGEEAGAQAGGALTAQMQARHAQYSALPGFSALPPETQAVLIGGGSLLPLTRTVGTGGGFAGELRSQGYDVPKNIKDDQWVTTRQLGGGQTTFTPGAAPGQKAGENGQLMGPLAMEQAKQTIDLPFYHKKIGMQLAKSLALQQNAFDLAIQSGALKDADKIYSQNWSDLKQRQGALTLMEQNYQQALQGNQQAMVSLLFNHIGMTSGAVKGTRMARANIEEAMQSTPWISSIISKWFHQDEKGDYIYDGLKGGINLNKPQMEQMMELARDRVAVQRQVLDTMSQTPGFSGEEALPPGVSAVGGFTATKNKKLSEPPKPPSGGGAPPTPPTATAGKQYKFTATGPGNHKIGSDNGVTWFDVKTGAAVR